MPKKIKELLSSELPARNVIEALREKTITVPVWGTGSGLVSEYDPKLHPVMNRQHYPDQINEEGMLEPVTRVTYDLQRLAVKRMSELVCGIPVKRVYKPENDRQAEIAKWLEAIFRRNRIDSVNVDRCNRLFAGCEIMTLWYATEQKNSIYGFDSPVKLRCRTFSPMLGDELYPYFDEYGDMTAMSVGYTRKVGKKDISFFDTYTEDRHIKWSNESGDWTAVEYDRITLMKIPCIYCWRPTPIWEDTSRMVFEMEWAMSRNGNYLRKNSKPLFVVTADEEIAFGGEDGEKSEKKEFRSVLQFPKGSTAQYVTWGQAVENLKFYVTELRQSFFTQLQLPDWSYESMKSTPMSGESRKQLFIDCQLKVKDESGRLLEFFDREVNVLKAFLKAMTSEKYHADIDALKVENVIIPFMMNDDRETVETLMAANGNKPLISQRESIESFGRSEDVDGTMKEIESENKKSVFQPYE